MLFPTLIAACFENEENKKIIEQEVSCALLENYIEVREGKLSVMHLVVRFHSFPFHCVGCYISSQALIR